MSRTIPIWACVINRTCYRLRQQKQQQQQDQEEEEEGHNKKEDEGEEEKQRWDQFWAPPWVGDSERAQIEKKLEGFVQRLLARYVPASHAHAHAHSGSSCTSLTRPRPWALGPRLGSSARMQRPADARAPARQPAPAAAARLDRARLPQGLEPLGRRRRSSGAVRRVQFAHPVGPLRRQPCWLLTSCGHCLR